MIKSLLALALGVVLAAPAIAQTIEGPIRMIVGFSPGGGVDALARITAQQLEKNLGTSVIVENKPGAGGTLAADYVARSTTPNTTILFGDSSLLVAPFIYPSVRYDLTRDLLPLATVGEATLALAVKAEHPASNLQEFLVLAKQSPEAVAYSSVGVGSLHHLAGELLADQEGLKLLHVPYRGGAQASQALVSNDVEMAISSLASIMPLVNANKVRLLSVLSDTRFPTLPDVPTVRESVSEYEATPSLFIMAPAKMDPTIADALEKELARVLQETSIQDYFIQQGSVVKPGTSEELAQWLTTESAQWQAVINNAQIAFE